MPAVPRSSKVLLTGANGYLGAQIAKQLLDAGFAVRGTVRSAEKGEYLQRLFSSYDDRFEYAVIPDPVIPTAYDQAVQGVDAVIHQAATIRILVEDLDEVLKPNVEGTVTLLNSLKKFGTQTKRLVLTSSDSAIMEPHNGPYEWSEDDWNHGSVRAIKENGAKVGTLIAYMASKTLQEKYVWDFVEKNRSEIHFDAVAVLPGLIEGPSVFDAPSPTGSLVIPQAVFNGEKSPLEPLNTVDVRDVAELHVRALLTERAGGERFVAIANNVCFQDMLDAVHSLVPDPTHVPRGTPGSGKDRFYEKTFKNEKSKKFFEFQYRGIDETYRDTYKWFVEKRWIKIDAAQVRLS